jgi:hypothetical protein
VTLRSYLPGTQLQARLSLGENIGTLDKTVIQERKGREVLCHVRCLSKVDLVQRVFIKPST